nr:unnamed protein product [Callosobruchus analis]
MPLYTLFKRNGAPMLLFNKYELLGLVIRIEVQKNSRLSG